VLKPVEPPPVAARSPPKKHQHPLSYKGTSKAAGRGRRRPHHPLPSELHPPSRPVQLR